MVVLVGAGVLLVSALASSSSAGAGCRGPRGCAAAAAIAGTAAGRPLAFFSKRPGALVIVGGPAHPHHLNPVSPPSVQTGAAVDVSTRQATMTGTVNPDGGQTAFWFQYGTSTEYGSQTSSTSAGSGDAIVAVASALPAPQAATTYHYRLVASSSAGTRYGADEVLTTVGYYKNPVYGTVAAPDPYVLDDGESHNDYYAFTTGDLFPVLHSSDLVNWTPVGTAMSKRPSWVVSSGDWHPWAPSVTRVDEPCASGSSPPCYVMYYVGLSAKFNSNCVAVATATSPAGPYLDHGPLSNGTTDAQGRPIGCGDNSGYGMIDPSPFWDPASQRWYLYGSEDFSCPPASASCTSQNSTLQPTISVIPLSADRLQAAGGRTALFSGDAGTWEGFGVNGVPTVEGPTMMLHNGTYYLLYSGGSWQQAYGMGYATGPTPTGPFTKAPINPILTGTPSVLSPGGGDTPVTGPHGGLWLVYHGRDSSLANPRTLRIDPFGWQPARVQGQPDIPVISGPTSTPQSAQP